LNATVEWLADPQNTPRVVGVAERTNTSNEVGTASIRPSMRISLTALTLASYACGARMASPRQAKDS
jgi:hypothetical protein